MGEGASMGKCTTHAFEIETMLPREASPGTEAFSQTLWAPVGTPRDMGGGWLALSKCRSSRGGPQTDCSHVRPTP